MGTCGLESRWREILARAGGRDASLTPYKAWPKLPLLLSSFVLVARDLCKSRNPQCGGQSGGGRGWGSCMEGEQGALSSILVDRTS